MSNLDKLKNATPRSLRSMTKQEMEVLRTNCLIIRLGITWNIEASSSPWDSAAETTHHGTTAGVIMKHIMMNYFYLK